MSFLISIENIPEFEELIEGTNDYWNAVEIVKERIAYWNNFHDGVPLVIKIEKTKLHDTLEVAVNDQTQTTEQLS